MSKDSSKTTRNDRTRKVRPTMQLYCPRMLRTAAVGRKVDSREKNANTEQSAKSVNTVKGYVNLNSHVGSRQRNSNCSLNGGTYKAEENSNKSLRKSSNSINNLYDHLADNFGSPKRRPGRRKYSSSNNCYSSESLCEGCSTDNEIYLCNGPASSQFGSKVSSRNQKEIFDLNSSPPGGLLYADGIGLSRTSFDRRSPLNRQRDWSFRSNQSEDFKHCRHRNNKNSCIDRTSNIPQDNNQDAGRNEILTNKSKAVSKHISFQDLYASLDSIDLASFDWSSEVEAEERRKKEREEQERTTEKHPPQTNPSGSQNKRSRRGLESLSKFQNRSGASNGSNGFSRLYSRNIKDPSVGRGRRFTNLPRQRNDSFTSQTSSIAESIEEQRDIEGGSGERTPTNDDRKTTLNFSTQDNGNKVETCYLDVNRVPRSGDSTTNCTHRGGHENRGRNKRGNRWKMRKQHNLGETEVVVSHRSATSQYTQNNTRTSNRDSDLNVPASNILKATSSAPIKGIRGLKKVELRNFRDGEKYSDVPSASVGSATLLTEVSNGGTTESRCISESSLGRTKSNRFRRELPPTEWPIHLEISCKEGPQIQILNDTINRLIDRITEFADLSAGEEILVASESLSRLYLSIVTRNISYTYTMNLEQHLWKQCFYTSIEALRAASNSTGNSSRIFRSNLSKLIQQGLAFYALLLNKYEVAFGFIIDDYLYWPSNLPLDDFVGCILTGSAIHEATDHIIKVALLSVQRLAVSVGDLHRYSSMVSGIKDYSHARVWYQKAAQLAAGNGRSYNQLALLAVYESKWIDVIFYYVRALAARYPFETARQPLFTAFNHVQKKVSEFEIEFNARVGDTATREAEAAAVRADRPQEIWIAQDGKLSSRNYADITDHRAIHALRSVSTVEV
ncbi:unnamed protein product [Wuchereria bancrofti]|uniref:Uncharacterized protein n=1 Tax=Wuchereria bancrofti TaxID=6293 RepID=A0A3P7EWA2_WUCBA|nr:unnamed protein product [Wuchereria bancrofti]